ncbi:MAG: phosphomannomutase/phosphoglucomutase [Oligoflexia bacterium]|nr:phosphomannomutase/phosphoglucomutase [Oligoflexia bacterium]
MFSPSIFRANDIRGVWQKDFDLSFTKDLAFALALLAKQKRIKSPKFLIGYDARLSSPSLSKSLARSLKDQGCQVSMIGLAPSPLCYFLTHHCKLTAGVVVTASHNPSEFNGFKILFHKKYKILKPISLLKKILSQTKEQKKVFKTKGGFLPLEKEKAYIDSLKKEFYQSYLNFRPNCPSRESMPSWKHGGGNLHKKLQKSNRIGVKTKPISFIVDTGNGALGPLAKKVFKSLGLKVKVLYEKPDGRFPHHHPDPTVEKNLKDLKRELKKEGFEFGCAFDGDGDRLVLVNSKGKSLLGDELAFLLLKSLKPRKKPLVLADVKCSDWFFQKAKKQGVKIKMTKSGHGLIRAEMEKTKALLAVEFSGHIFFNDRKNRGFDDALYACLRWIEFFNSQKKSLEELLPQVLSAKTGEIRLNMPEREVKKKLLKVKDYLIKRRESFKSLDGVRLSREDGWCLFRSSKTQSALTMRFEARTKEELKNLKEEFSQVMDCKIP